MISLTINGKTHELDVDPDTPLLWVVRDELGLTGAKFGCGVALCGACTMYADGSPIRACVTPVSSVEGQKITTPEGLEGKLKPLPTVPCHITYGDGSKKTIQIKCRIDTASEIEYIEHGGVLHYVLRDLASR